MRRVVSGRWQRRLPRWLPLGIVALLAATMTVSAVGSAQPPVRPAPVTTGDSARRDSTARAGAARDTAGRDSTGRDTTLVHWAPTDSVFDALLQRSGYSITRYQGDSVVFFSEGRRIALTGASGRGAAGRGRRGR